MSETEQLARQLNELRDKLIVAKYILRESRKRLDELEAAYEETLAALRKVHKP